MKSIRLKSLLFLLLSCFLFSSGLKASHFTGVTITYECLGGCTYKIWMTQYTVCPPPAILNPSGFMIEGSTMGCSSPTMVQGWVGVDTIQQEMVCPGTLTNCDTITATVPGHQRFRYYSIYDFCNMNCTDYYLTWNHCCRNSAYTGVTPSQEVYTGQTNLHLGVACNSSPVWCAPHRPWVVYPYGPTVLCMGAHDPDGDSLVYSLGHCYRTAADTLANNPGYNYQNPLGPDWTITIDPDCGDLTLVPHNPVSFQSSPICVYVEEYRNGQKIGQIVRDVEIQTYNIQNTPPQILPPSNVENGIANGFEVSTCVGSDLCFLLEMADSMGGANTSIWWLDTLPGATFADTAGLQFDSIAGAPAVAKFCWTPTVAGDYAFCVEARDDFCPMSAWTSRMVKIHVSAGPVAPTVTLYQPDSLVASSATSYQWYLDSLLIPGATGQSHIAAQPGLYYVCTTDQSGCTTCSDTLSVLPVSIASPAQQGLEIFPNPGKDKVRVTGLDPEAEIRLYDLHGRIVYSTTPNRRELVLDISHLAEGLYLLRSGDAHKKLVVKR